MWAANCGRPQYVLSAAAATKTAKHDKVSRQEYLFKTLSPDWRFETVSNGDWPFRWNTRLWRNNHWHFLPLDAGSKCVLAFPWNVVIFCNRASLSTQPWVIGGSFALFRPSYMATRFYQIMFYFNNHRKDDKNRKTKKKHVCNLVEISMTGQIHSDYLTNFFGKGPKLFSNWQHPSM